MKPELEQQCSHFRVLDCEIFGTLSDARSLARMLSFFNKNSVPKIYVDCDWRGQAHIGWVDIDDLEEGHGIIKVKK